MGEKGKKKREKVIYLDVVIVEMNKLIILKRRFHSEANSQQDNTHPNPCKQLQIPKRDCYPNGA